MKPLLAAVVAAVVAGLLYLNLDSGRVGPPAERLVSLPLLGLALMFAGGSWAATKGAYPHRAPWFAGLSAGVGGYALLRLFV